jgi:hypothetical protein
MKKLFPDSRAWMVFAYVAGAFFIGLLVTELFGEIPPDIDLKPYFIPMLFIITLPSRYGWTIGLGAAVGEGIGDLIEGYEVDDPVGFVTYVVAFAVAGMIINGEWEDRVRVLWAGIAAGTVNALPEAFMFAVMGGVGATTAVVSALGNIVSHGVLLGALPLFFVTEGALEFLRELMGFRNDE